MEAGNAHAAGLAVGNAILWVTGPAAACGLVLYLPDVAAARRAGLLADPRLTVIERPDRPAAWAFQHGRAARGLARRADLRIAPEQAAHLRGLGAPR